MESYIKDYIKANILPIIIEIVFIISVFVLPSEYHIYTNTLFYLFLLIYIIRRKDFNFDEWSSKLKSGMNFWKGVIFTLVGFIAAFIITVGVEKIFPSIDTGAIQLRVNNWLALLCFIFSTVLLPAVTEEIVYRKNMIIINRKSIIITSLISVLLFSAEHYLTAWGILLGVIWAIPFTISYIKTKDVYIPMTAHFLVSLFGNGADIVKMFLMLIQQK